MKDTPRKFQAISEDISFNVDGYEIVCDSYIKLFGVALHYQFNFKSQISEICNIKEGYLRQLIYCLISTIGLIKPIILQCGSRMGVDSIRSRKDGTGVFFHLEF